MQVEVKTPLRMLLFVFALIALVGVGHAQEKFKSRHYRVRVAVNDQVEGLVLQTGQSAYQVASSEGRALLQVNPGQVLFVQITRGKPGQRTYRLVLKEYDAHLVDTAIAAAKAAKSAYNQPVKVFRIPAREKEEARILVTLGEFARIDDARAFIRQLPKEQIAFIYEERGRALQGQVRLVNRDGAILARDSHFLRLIPLDILNGELSCTELEGGRWSPAGLNKARRYRGEMELTMNEEGTLTAVNDLWVEYYLYAVVGAEIGAEAPDEALKAQAACGRSEAVAKIERGIISSSFFDFYNSSIAQVYRGKQDETERVRRAVDATRGEILVWNNPQSGLPEVVDAVYGDTCGGYIASSEDVWGGEYEGYSVRRLDSLLPQAAPNLGTDEAVQAWLKQPMPDGLCNPNQLGFPGYNHRSFRWNRSLDGGDFSREANSRYGTGTLQNIVVSERSASGRVKALRLTGSRKSVRVSRELEIRSLLGDIPSNLFVLDVDRGGDAVTRVSITGGGFGHGVGMCQMGTYMLGKMGYNYRQILGHYFDKVKIRRLYR
jgi:peptidoglycan hydrolase-like amidase